MHFSQTLPVIALVAGAQAAQYTVQVANQDAQLIFTPNVTNAAVGDTIQFVFNPNNHTVTEASFDAPCKPLAGGQGFNSGFHPNKKGEEPQMTFTVTLTDSNPHWFYCAQAKHCESGMVGVINPPASGNNIAAFAAAAAAVPASVIDEVSIGGVNGTTTGNTTTNGTTTSSTGGSVVTSYSQAIITSQTVVTSNGQVQTVAFTATTSVPIAISSQAGAKGQLVGLGAAAAGLAAMFL